MIWYKKILRLTKIYTDSGNLFLYIYYLSWDSYLKTVDIRFLLDIPEWLTSKNTS